MRAFFVLSLFALAASGCSTTDQTDEACDKMCVELFETCEYDAYPSYDSCMAGCAYNRDQGGDVEHEGVCITQAACDEAAIIECEHAWGPGGTELSGDSGK